MTEITILVIVKDNVAIKEIKDCFVVSPRNDVNRDIFISQSER